MKHVTLANRQVNSETWRTQRGKRHVLVVRDKTGRFNGSRSDQTVTVKALLSR